MYKIKSYFKIQKNKEKMGLNNFFTNFYLKGSMDWNS